MERAADDYALRVGNWLVLSNQVALLPCRWISILEPIAASWMTVQLWIWGAPLLLTLGHIGSYGNNVYLRL